MNWFRWNDRPVIVLGMHRSGTSMFTSILQRCGIFMGNDLSSNRESYTFTHFNEKLLNNAGATWYRPKSIETSDMSFDTKEFGIQFLNYRRQAVDALKYMAGRSWGWKDPRNTFTLPYWLHYFPEARVIHVYRNGTDVSRSLHKRNASLQGSDRLPELDDISYCFKLWETYIEEAERAGEKLKNRYMAVQYEALLQCEAGLLKKMETFLRIPKMHRAVKGTVHKAGKGHSGHGEDLTALAQASPWMRKLGYLNVKSQE